MLLGCPPQYLTEVGLVAQSLGSQFYRVSFDQETLYCVAERIVLVARDHMRRTSDIAEFCMGNQFPEFSGAFGRNKVARSTTH